MNSQELAQAVEARLGRSVFVSASQGELAVQGHVRKESPGFLVTLTVSRADGSITGKRELGPSKDCRDLDEALVLVIALLLDPDVTTTDLDEEQTSEAEDASVVAMEPNAAARSWKPAVYLGPALWLGPLPGVAFAGEFGVRWGRGSVLQVELGAASSLPARLEADGIRTNLQLYLAELAVCRDFLESARFRWGLCASAEGGAMSASSMGLEQSARRVLPYGALGGRLRAGWRVSSRFWLEFNLALRAAPVRPVFFYTFLDSDTLDIERGDLWKAHLLHGGAGLRAVATF